jgi:hypothetical protein
MIAIGAADREESIALISMWWRDTPEARNWAPRSRKDRRQPAAGRLASCYEPEADTIGDRIEVCSSES